MRDDGEEWRVAIVAPRVRAPIIGQRLPKFFGGKLSFALHALIIGCAFHWLRGGGPSGASDTHSAAARVVVVPRARLAPTRPSFAPFRGVGLFADSTMGVAKLSHALDAIMGNVGAAAPVHPVAMADFSGPAVGIGYADAGGGSVSQIAESLPSAAPQKTERSASAADAAELARIFDGFEPAFQKAFEEALQTDPTLSLALKYEASVDAGSARAN